jgi:hypothetical protein
MSDELILVDFRRKSKVESRKTEVNIIRKILF